MCRAIFLFICLTVTLFFVQVTGAPDARADGIDFNSSHRYTKSQGTTKFKLTGEKLDTDFDEFDQIYNLNLQKSIYPYLVFSTGAVYQIFNTSSTTGDNKVDTEEKNLAPYVELDLTNPIYKAGLVYRYRRVDEDITDVPDTKTERDEITSTVGMRPPSELFPDWNLRYSHIHTYDNPETLDEIQKLWQVDTAYTPLSNLYLNYTYFRTDTEEKFLNFDTLQQQHQGRAAYGRSFLDGRLSMDSVYTVNYNKFELSSSGNNAQVPLLRFEGLSSLNSTPDDGPALADNPALIDGNLTASAGLDIGTAGDQSQEVNIGLDFGFEVNVDTIHVWVDRNLTAPVANSFSWGVYTSPDNNDLSTWTLVATVSPADFGTLDNRFEISFPQVNTRFIKVVTPALSPVVPGAGAFPNIFVTEMQAFSTASGASANQQTSVLNQNFNLGLRGQLSDRTLLGYNFFYNRQSTDPSNLKRTQYINGLYLNHIFDQIFSANVNGQRTDTPRAEGSAATDDSYNYNYGASLRANWLNTFNQSLTFSGSYNSADLGTDYQNSIFLRNNAILYRGWSAFMDAGYTWQEPNGGSRVTSYIIKQGTSVQPNQQISVDLNFSYKQTQQSDQDIGPNRETRWNIQGFYTPLRNLSFFAEIDAVYRTGDNDIFQNYSVNWSPFPDGDLQFFFNFSETLLSDNNREERVYGPSLKWSIGPHIYLDVSYSFNTIDSDIEEVKSNVFGSEIKLKF
jgi:hypothetical protein